MQSMTRTKQSRSEADLWLNLAKDKGLEAFPSDRETVYNIEEKITNVKYSQVEANRARFSLGSGYLEQNELFVFICKHHSIFYVFPRDVMQQFVKVTTRDANSNRPVFDINIKKHMYHPGKGPPIPIVEYYQRWDLFGEYTNFENEVEILEHDYSKQIEKLSPEEIDLKLSKFQIGSTDLIDPADKAKRRFVNQYKRNAELSALLKAKFDYTCQLCGIASFEGKRGNNYVETHHIIPRGMKGHDSPKNIVVVCPTCHRRFDKGSIKTVIKVYQLLREKELFSNFDLLLDSGIISDEIYKQVT